MFNILSIDGGGVRGIIPAVLLEKLEDEMQRPIHEVFDLVVGTSVGGLIALALTKENPLPASEIVKLFQEKSKQIFPKATVCRKISTLCGVLL